MTALTTPLHSPDLSLAQAGGKGANLSRLIRAGFAVPAGFVISTDAYRQFVQENELAEPIAVIARQTGQGKSYAYEKASAEIRHLFRAGRLPGSLRRVLKTAYAELAPAQEPLAVRSSATAEDLPDASFAGQQDTFLNVVGEKAFFAAVVDCWSSLWTARAIAYRERQDIPPEEVALAVVVQRMVPADVAGVLFTVNPVSGDGEQVLINATFGLGEALVSGQVNPDEYTADKASGALLDVTIGQKELMTAAQAQGTQELAVPPDRRQQRALDDEQVRELAQAGAAIEAHFGSPQDVEWAFADGALLILQSRPVTTVAPPAGVPGDDDWPPARAKPPQPFDLWGQADLGERWPDPVTPLTWAIWKPITEKNMHDNFAGLGEDWVDDIEWMCRAYGHAYLNEGALAYAMHRGYGMPASYVGDGMGSVPELLEKYRGWKWLTILRRAPFFLQLMRNSGRLIAKFERDFPVIDEWVDRFMARDLSPESDRSLWQEAHDVWLARGVEYIDCHAASTSQSMTTFTQVEGMLKRFTGDSGPMQALVTGLEGVIQAEIVPGVWALTESVRRRGLESVLLENDPEAALEILRATPEAAPVLQALNRFLQRHGHRCASEAEFLYPRWIEKPSLVIEQIAGYLRAGDDFDPTGAEARQKALRERATAGIKARMNPVQWRFFRASLQRLQHLVRMRDNGQHFLVKLLLPTRHIFATLGARWADAGLLAQPEDIFFLAVEEIEALIAGVEAGAPPDLRPTVAARRQAWAYWTAQPSFPLVLAADGAPIASEAEEGGATLTGIGASAGLVTGKARVILSPEEATSVERGEILVTRATDPGWTPLFAIVGGVVLEIGGQLSHGAIVAREYGLPAVINVPGATQRIADGQTVTVDGGNGRVILTAGDSD